MHGVGRWLRQGQLTDVLPHSLGDTRDCRLHCGHHALRFRDALSTRLADAFLLGDAADSVDVALDIAGNQLPVAPYTTLQVDKVIRMTDGPDALSDHLSLPHEMLVLVARCVYRALGLFQTRGHLGRTPRAVLCRRVVGVVALCLHPCAHRFRLRRDLGGCPL
jgi:hypothetical protein